MRYVVSLIVFALLIPISTAEAKNYPDFPHCNTWKCVTHTKQIRKDRLHRCKRHSRLEGASWFSGSNGAFGNLSDGGNYYAELGRATGSGGHLGHLPAGYRLDIIYGGKIARAYLRDVGAGGGAVGGLTRSIDLHSGTAQALGFGGVGVVRVSHNRCF